MKLQFKHQQFQAEAASAVCDVFAGQPNQSPDYRRDIGVAYPSAYQSTFGEGGMKRSPELDEVGYKNNPIAISDRPSPSRSPKASLPSPSALL